ncbi:MAG: hypothetical protein WBA25_13655 [Jannaschia sp.]
MTLVLPVLALASVAWLLPWALGRALPERPVWLLVNGVVSAILLAGLSGAGFVWLYGPAGIAVWEADPAHFAALALRAGLIWGPIVILSLSAQPGRWRSGTW